MSTPKNKRHKRIQNLRKKSKVVEEMKVLPALVPGAVNIPFTPDELSSYAQLLSIMSQGLQQMADDASNDPTSRDILTARSQLSALLAGKLGAHYTMGESPSREVH